MITGTGVDIVHVPRIKKLMDEHGERFLEKILTPEEIKAMPQANKDLYTAGRFAAKESLVKASGKTFSFSSVSVMNEASGRPYFTGAYIEEFTGRVKVHLSISHDTDYAAAFVVIESLQDFSPGHPPHPK